MEKDLDLDRLRLLSSFSMIKDPLDASEIFFFDLLLPIDFPETAMLPDFWDFFMLFARTHDPFEKAQLFFLLFFSYLLMLFFELHKLLWSPGLLLLEERREIFFGSIDSALQLESLESTITKEPFSSIDFFLMEEQRDFYFLISEIFFRLPSEIKLF